MCARSPTTSNRRSRCRPDDTKPLPLRGREPAPGLDPGVESAKRTRVRVIGSARTSSDRDPQEETERQQCHNHKNNRVKATIVGSLPKPGWLAAPGELFPPWRLEGDQPRRRPGGRRSRLGRRAGARRPRLHHRRRTAAPALHLGFLPGAGRHRHGQPRDARPAGQRYHKEIAAARLIGGPEYRGPIFVDALRATLALTDRPVKVTLPGPMTIVDSLVDTIGGRSEEQLAMRFAELLNLEARALVRSRRRRHPVRRAVLQCLHRQGAGTGASRRWNARPTGSTAKKAVHICYGYGTADVKRWKSANQDWSHYAATLPLLAKSSIDQVSVETAASGVDVAVIEALRGKDVLLGVVDVGSEAVETPETVAERLHRGVALHRSRPSLCLHRLRHVAAVAPRGGGQVARARCRCGSGERQPVEGDPRRPRTGGNTWPNNSMPAQRRQRTEKERLHAIRLTATASLIGTTIEWYDFILYTSLAGLIFNKLFFPADNRAGIAAAGLCHVRRGLHHPPDRRRLLRPFRRPHRPQATAGADFDDDGDCDVPDRPGADLRRRSASPRR